jgi:hypothetical protein
MAQPIEKLFNKNFEEYYFPSSGESHQVVKITVT